MKELKNNRINNYEDYPKIFGISESEVLEIMEAKTQYGEGEKSQSLKDWGEMYRGIHHESTGEIELRGWLACYRWMKSRQSLTNPLNAV